MYKVLILLLLLILIPGSLAYTPITDKCVGCHDGSIAGYKRPHNNTVMCEQCHTQGMHSGYSYIQPDGTLTNNKSTAATCIDCHETGVPGFSNAPIIPNLKHGSKINNGSIWGSYWSSDRNSISCLYCHGNTKHDIIALGNIKNLTNDTTNMRNASISGTTWCIDCHYNGTEDIYYKGDLWNPTPPLITIKNTANDKWVDHISYLKGEYNDSKCKSCHPINGVYPDLSSKYVHSIGGISGDACIECHGTNYTVESSSSSMLVDIGLFNISIHQNINNTVPDVVTNDDCWMCHYNKDMNRQNVEKCGYCHNKASQWHGNANVTTNLTALTQK